MRIDSRERIAGQPAIAIRDVLRRVDSFTVECLASALKLPSDEAAGVLAELQARGFVEPTAGEREEPGTFGLTVAGARFRSATGARELTRPSAERILHGFLDRVVQVNADPSCAFRVRRALLFGSMLDASRERVSDVDVAIELRAREDTKAAQQRLEQERIRIAFGRGRRFSNIVLELVWPRHEVLLRLKSRSRGLSLHEVQNLDFLDDTPTRVVFDASRATLNDVPR